MEPIAQIIKNLISPSATLKPLPGDSLESDWVNPFTLLDASVHPDFARAHAAAREWVYAVSSGQARGLVLWSRDFGCGKTALAWAAYGVLRVMLDHRGNSQRVTFLNVADFFGDIKDAYARGDPEAPLFSDWTRGHFILDDFGKQYTTEAGELWAREKFYKLINNLCERRGFLLTSNMDPEEINRIIGGASASRLMGMCGANGFIDLSAVPDYRLAKVGL